MSKHKSTLSRSCCSGKLKPAYKRCQQLAKRECTLWQLWSPAVTQLDSSSCKTKTRSRSDTMKMAHLQTTSTPRKLKNDSRQRHFPTSACRSWRTRSRKMLTSTASKTASKTSGRSLRKWRCQKSGLMRQVQLKVTTLRVTPMVMRTTQAMSMTPRS